MLRIPQEVAVRRQARQAATIRVRIKALRRQIHSKPKQLKIHYIPSLLYHHWETTAPEALAPTKKTFQGIADASNGYKRNDQFHQVSQKETGRQLNLTQSKRSFTVLMRSSRLRQLMIVQTFMRHCMMQEAEAATHGRRAAMRHVPRKELG